MAEKRCWRCGKETELQRCHLIPDSLGGKDEASNIVLLCDKCHKEGPNVADPEIMWDWIKAYAQPNQFMFLFYQISRECEFIYRNLSIELRHVPGIEYKKMIVAKIWYKSQYATNFLGQPF